MLRRLKLTALRLSSASGVTGLLADSRWRRERLLILCYHGISRYDEHEWSDLYMAPDLLRRRMQLLVEERCNVLPLSEAIDRLRDGTLPARAVVITFDDGFHDFYSTAFPTIESFGFPVTLYLTTYYVEYNRPVFDPMCSYLLWKGRATKRLEWPEVFAAPVTLDDAGRTAAEGAIREFAQARKLSAREKDSLLAQLAERLGIDYEELCRRRMLHLISAQEARALTSRGLDLQLHTHRHRVYRARQRMFAELDDNRERLEAYGSRAPRHFCYTSGFYLPEHLEYLAAYGIRSSTTCFTGLCTVRTDPLQLPRLCDRSGISELEFRGWLAGTAALLPRRAEIMDQGQLLELDDARPASTESHLV
jgi:peptidoglycan/xylan/chitin deacetylase (PgdA/CDA1 family)